MAQGNDIFMGTVTDMQVYRVTGKVNEYFTVATVEVKDSIRGEMENGEVCRIYLPLAEINGMVVTDSLVENLMKLEIGSNAIFMPKTATADTGLGKQNAGEWLCYADFADYYFSEGMRYLFLETESKPSFLCPSGSNVPSHFPRSSLGDFLLEDSSCVDERLTFQANIGHPTD